MRYDAVILGAGPAGGTAALRLARAGMRVAIVEKSGFPRRKVCGEFISASTWPLLRRLGVARELAPLAGPAVRRVGLFAGDTVATAPMPVPPQSDPWGRAVGREHLDQALLEAAVRTGAAAWLPWRVEGLREEAGAWRVAVRERGGRVEQLEARIVVAAHGSWGGASLTSAAAGAPRRDAELLGFKAHFHDAALDPALMPLVLFPGGYGGLVRSDGGRTSFSCCIRRDALRRCRAAHPGLPAGEAMLAEALRACRGLREALQGGRREAPWMSAGPIRPGVRSLARRGLFAVGNAAGEAHPLVAEGITMAIQSAWLLAEALDAQGALDDAALARAGEHYARWWRRNFAARVRASRLFAGVVTGRGSARAGIVALAAVPALLTLGAAWSGKARALRPIGSAL